MFVTGTVINTEGMLTINDGVISSGQAMLVTVCLTVGSLIGEIIDIEGLFEKFGEWLKLKTGNAKDAGCGCIFHVYAERMFFAEVSPVLMTEFRDIPCILGDFDIS